MNKNSDRDIINLLYQHSLHEDEIFNERLNFFLIIESVLLGVIGIFATMPVQDKRLIGLFISLGLFLTII